MMSLLVFIRIVRVSVVYILISRDVTSVFINGHAMIGCAVICDSQTCTTSIVVSIVASDDIKYSISVDTEDGEFNLWIYLLN